MTPTRFADSEISGSEVVCTSPKLIAAYHVLHRFRTPRHPPYALISLTKKIGEQRESLPAVVFGLEDACFSIPYAVVKERIAYLHPALGTGEAFRFHWWR
jgi:hypothetical protein